MRLFLGPLLALVFAAPAGAATTVSPLSLSFEDQAVGTLSASKTIRITGISDYWYSVTPAWMVHGDHPEDFLVTRRDCDADGSYTATPCFELRVRFAPGATGTRSALLRIQNLREGYVKNLPLGGAGVAAPAATPGAPGAPGASGAPGAPGPKGAAGPRGRAAKVTCKVKRSKGTRRIRITCSTKRATAARVRLARKGRVIASRVRPSRDGRVVARFEARRGRYVVTIGGRAVRVRG